MPKIKAIIFDFDGTIVDTEERHRQAFNKAFEEFNIPFQWNVTEYIRLLAISGGRERILKFLLAKNFNAHGNESMRDYVFKLHQRKSEIYRSDIAANYPISPRTGIVRLIAEARQKGIAMAIATSSSGKNVTELLKNALGTQALSYFKLIATCDIIISQKPSPAVYQYTLANLGINPANCIAIEDTYSGNRAVLAAGIKSVITTHALTTNEDFSGADLVVDHLGEPDKSFIAASGNTFNASYVNIGVLEKIISAGHSC